ncbi:trimethylamine methyltransferase family protein [Candidatus Formimonas warabiya]|uniref:Trimethylamine methyltransferase n=1 Tax=Formimonas warabiya TaxID=1761012 RepID=A0A3G1KQU8_FORW1|nr:trimethylamine methyltransferase family protein [Candidatus Formimonas warabiya]ATW24852.1 hypothetical protein DCMF_08760 [Candidatus Formimonas warabiya]
MAKNLRLRIAHVDEIALMKSKVQELLAKQGMKVDHPKVLKYLERAGAKVSSSSGKVLFPKELQEEMLSQAPRSFTLAGIDPKYDLKFPHPEGLFYTRAITGSMYYIDALTDEYRGISKEDLADYITVTQALEHIDFWSLLTLKVTDFPPETMDIHAFEVVLHNSTKHGWLQPYEAENVTYMMEMAAAVVGGMDELKNRPIVSNISCSAPPFDIKYMDSEAIYQSGKYGIPIHVCSLPTAGANAPVTPAGVALMAAAETVAMTIMVQCIGPGTPCILTPIMYEMDMSSTHALQATVSIAMARGLVSQLIEEGYGLPCHSFAGGSDAFVVGAESACTDAYITQLVSLSDATILGDVGHLETGKTASPIQLIIDNDLFGYAKVVKKGFEINEDTMGFEELLNLAGREAFITMNHTFRHFKENYRPKVFNRISRPAWVEQGSKEMIERTRDIYKSIKENHKPIVLPNEVEKELQSIIKSAEKNLGKRSK